MEINEISVGDMVTKKSGKPFKNGDYFDIVTKITENTFNPKGGVGAKFRNNKETIVSLIQLELVL